jgi:hypothetical protein
LRRLKANCNTPMENEIRRILLPGSSGGRCNLSVAQPVRLRSFRIILDREARDYAARASASLSLALMSFEPFHGLFMPGKNNAFQRTSILVQPRQ